MDHFTRLLACCSLLVSAASLLPSANTAYAQVDNGYSVGIGGSIGIKPKYEGSNDYETYGFPLIVPELSASNSAFSGRVKFRGLDDVRYRAFEAGGFELGPLAGYAFGREDDDGPLLRGLGDVDGGLVLGGYVGYRLGIALFDVSYHQIVTGDDDGYQVRLGAEVERKVTSRSTVTARIGTTFADDTYMSSYFGVSTLQAANSLAGLPEYNARAGIKDVHFALATVTELTDRWKLRVGGEYSRLLGDAADSPVVESENQFSAIVGLTYRFDFQH